MSDKPKPLSGSNMARRIVERADPQLLRHSMMWHRWTGPHWEEMDDDDLHQLVWRAVEEMDPNFEATAARANGVKEALRGTCRKVSAMDSEPGLISFKNGILDVETGEMRPHTPEMVNRSSMPYDYDPDAPPPERWLEFLHQLWPEQQDIIDCLQHWFGLNLVPDTSQQRFVHLMGPKRSGKGTIAAMLRAVVGEDNVCSPSLSSLGNNQFALERAIGSLSMIISEAKLGGRSDRAMIMDTILQIVGEDSVDVRRMYKSSWHGVLPCRITMMSNEPLELSDDTGALMSRLVVLPMTESFEGREDTGLKARLMEERGAVLKWALEGLRRGGRLEQPATGAWVRRLQEQALSPLSAFVDQQCRTGPDLHVPKHDLIRAYRTWCADQGLTALPKNKLGQKLNGMGHRSIKPSVHGARVPSWAGLELVTGDAERDDVPI